MKTATFYIKQIIFLGTAGFLAWLCIGWWHLGWFWGSDTHFAWFFALALTAFFLVAVCTPIQAALSLRSDWISYLGGILAGPLAVILYLALNTQFDATWHNYVVRQAWMHFIFGLLGLWYSVNYRRRFGPNNSFKPSRPAAQSRR